MTGTAGADPVVERLGRETAALVARLRPWTPARWSAAARPGVTRADVVHHLVQVLADAAADAEGQPRRRVPRLDVDLVLPDQLAVVVADLLAAGAGEGAAALLGEVLLHRYDVDGSPPPAGAVEALHAAGPAEVLRRAREACVLERPPAG